MKNLKELLIKQLDEVCDEISKSWDNMEKIKMLFELKGVICEQLSKLK